MPRPWRVRYAGAKYHLTVRGNGRQVVFREPADYERFLEQLKAALEQDEVVLYAYALMTNHYHLLVETPLGNVPRFMQRLNTAYGMYFRYKHRQVGHCFQGRYGAKLVKGDDYVGRVIRYIHLNPVKVGRWQAVGGAEKQGYLEGYPWSSYRGYAGLGPAEEMIDYRWLKLMGYRTQKRNQAAYRRYIEETLAGEDEVLKTARGRSRYAIGDDRFLEETADDLRAAEFSKADTGDIAWPEKPRKGLEEILGPVLEAVGLTEGDLGRRVRVQGEAKRLAVELICRLSGASQRDVAKRLGYRSESAVGKQRHVLGAQCKASATLAKRLEKLINQLEQQLKG